MICLQVLLAEDFEDLQFISWPIKKPVVQVEFSKGGFVWLYFPTLEVYICHLLIY